MGENKINNDVQARLRAYSNEFKGDFKLETKEYINRINSKGYEINSQSDKLDVMFKEQYDLQLFLEEISISNELNQAKVDKTVLCIIDELFELLRETNYKYWRKHKEIDMPKLKMEYIDIFKFVLNLGLHLGITPNELFKLFIRKNSLNYQRKLGDDNE